MGIKIVADTSSDITIEEAKKWGIVLMPLSVTFGDETFKDAYELSHDDFFKKLIETDLLPTTSQISPFDYEQEFAKILENGDEVLCITLSSYLSGSYQSATIAASAFDGHISIIDSENVCVGERLLIERAMTLISQKKTLSEITDILNEERKSIRVIALLDTLEYLKKGGRISATVAFAGTLLNIKPVVAVENGIVAMKGKARGSKNANNVLRELITTVGGINFNKPLALAYSGLSRIVLDKYLEDCHDIYDGHIDDINSISVSSIGCTIGTHVGPGAIAIAFFSPAE